MFRLNYEKKDLGQSFALVVGVMIVSSIVLGLIFGTDASGWKFWLMQGLYTAIIGGSAFLYAGITRTKVFSATKLNVAPRYAHFLWGCLAVTFLVFCMTPLNIWLMDLIEKMGLKRPSVNLDNNLAGLLIVACLLPCFCEEIVFRGTIAESLASNKNKLATLAISGALFAVFHANPAQTVHQFVLGAFLTLLVLRSGSIWTSVIVHLFNNVFVVALSYTSLGNDAFWNIKYNMGWVFLFFYVGIVGFALSIFGYLKTTKSVWAVDDTQDEAEQVPVKNDTRSLVLLIVAVVLCALLWVLTLFKL